MRRVGIWANGSAVILGVTAMLCLASAGVRAQALPASNGEDLTLPPDMRTGAKPVRQARKPAPHRHAALAPTAADGRSAAGRPEKTSDPHPVDLGVTVRGGSGTSRVYGATGTSEAIQESGSAFGAAMKFGF